MGGWKETYRQLAEVEGLAGDEVVDDVGGPEIEAEELEGVEEPMVEDLGLEENVLCVWVGG